MIIDKERNVKEVGINRFKVTNLIKPEIRAKENEIKIAIEKGYLKIHVKGDAKNLLSILLYLKIIRSRWTHKSALIL